MKRAFSFVFAVLLYASAPAQQPGPHQFVNPMIGTGGHGHTFPGATLPFGMVQLSPDTRIDGSWDGCSGYHYSDSLIYGFSHTHLSGTGCSDYGDILLFPSPHPITQQKLQEGKISSSFDHRNEKASAGFYAVRLDNGVKVELTATTRTGLHKYEFPKSEFAYILLDLELRDKVTGASAALKDRRKITGFRQSEAWAKDQIVMYCIEFSQEFEDAYVAEGSVRDQVEPVSGTKVRICFKFRQKADRTILVKVGLSPVTIEGAEKNLSAEQPEWDFEKTKRAAQLAWDKELGRISISETDKDKRTVFYTALYHSMIHPNVAMDVDGMYRGRDGRSHMAEGFTYYTVFSLWDTFRAAHPLYTIIDRQRTLDFIKTFLAQYKHAGRLPVWELAGNETDCMIGYHSVSVITDAAVKGITDFNKELALEAMKKSATWSHFGLPAYIGNGYISMEDEHESVSKTLEYAYDDWCIAKMAGLLGKGEDYKEYMKRSQYWINVFDPQTGFMRPKKNGGWLAPFEPREVSNNFTEGNSWQYTFFVPQDIAELKRAMGGPQKFEKKLDDLFSAPSKTTGRQQADITGLIGQYAHGNEPSHHMAYLYNYVGRSSKTQVKLREILDGFYKNAPDGLIGNEDCGQMSAWYVLSALGFYQPAPGSTELAIGSPSFEKAVIHLENGKDFTLKAENVSKDRPYIASVTMNGKNYEKNYFDHADIVNGSTLAFRMTAQPVDWEGNTIPSATTMHHKLRILPNPVISAASRVFKEQMKVELSSLTEGAGIHYTIDGSDPDQHSPLYSGPFTVNKTTLVKAIVIAEKDRRSFVVQASFHKMPHPGWNIRLLTKYNSQYTAGGAEGLIDGLHGSLNWRKGDWQGYQYTDVECIVDMGRSAAISTFSAHCLQDSRSWILMPAKVEYYVSQDDQEYILAGTVLSGIQWEKEETVTDNFLLRLVVPVNARYIKVKAYNFGALPKGHQGFGDSAFVFIDELDFK